MSQTTERAKSRLKNLTAVEPLLSALKTISMGNWQKAKNRIRQIKLYENHYYRILADIMPAIEKTALKRQQLSETKEASRDSIFLLIGTELGLCGKFNESLSDEAVEWIQTQNVPSYEIWALGTKMESVLKRRRISYTWFQPFPAIEIGTYEYCFHLMQDWLYRFEQYEFNRLIVLYYQSAKGVGKLFSTQTLLPYVIQPKPLKFDKEKKWPLPIIETDPIGIYRQINQHLLASRLYQALLHSLIAESSSRFRIMNEAEQNAEEIMAELNQTIQTDRKRQITRQMQELAIGAGLIDKN